MIRSSKVANTYMKKSSVNLELHLYDFDMTLFKSPDPPMWWDRKKYGYWYNTQVSLGYPFVPLKPTYHWVNEVVRDAQDSINDVDTWAVMCTGRLDYPPIRYRIAELLKQRGLDFDGVYLKPDGVKTSRYKALLTHKLLLTHPRVSKVQVWEDTMENLDAIEHVCKKHKVAFEGHLIVERMVVPELTEADYRGLTSSNR